MRLYASQLISWSKSCGLCLLTLLSLLAFGCAAGPRSELASSPQAQLFPCEVKAVGLSRSLLISEPALDINKAGFPRFELSLENDSAFKTEIRYIVEWFDDRGLSMPSTMSHWTRKIIQGRQSLRIFAIGPSDKARRAHVTILPVTSPKSSSTPQPGD